DRARTLDLQDVVGFPVNAEAQARATVAIVAVLSHPLKWFEVWPFAVGLKPALDANDPFTFAIPQPNIRGGRIAEPPAAGFEVCCVRILRIPCLSREADCSDNKKQYSKRELGSHVNKHRTSELTGPRRYRAA